MENQIKLNVLEQFFASSSDASNLECSDQELLESNFSEWFNEKMKDFGFAARFLIQHMAENYHPHHTTIVNSSRAELLEGQTAFATEDYIVD